MNLATCQSQTASTDSAEEAYESVASQVTRHPLLAHLSPTQRLLILGDMDAPTSSARWRAAAEAMPAQPTVQARYALALLQDVRENTVHPDHAVTELGRIAERDADNGLYDVLEGFVLIEVLEWQADSNAEYWMEAVKQSPQVAERAWQAIARGAAKPIISTRSTQLLREQMDLLPPPRHVLEYLMRQMMQASLVLEPELVFLRTYRSSLRRMMAYSRWLKQQDENDEALAVLKALARINQAFAAEAQLQIQLMAAISAHASILDAINRHLAETGHGDAAARVLARYRELEEQTKQHLPHALRRHVQSSGEGPITAVAQITIAVQPDLDYNWPLYAKADRLFLLQSAWRAAIFLLLPIALAGFMVAAVQLLRTRDPFDRPRLLLPSPPQVLMIVLLVVALPPLPIHLLLGVPDDLLSSNRLFALSAMLAIGVVLLAVHVVRVQSVRAGLTIAPQRRWWGIAQLTVATVLVLITLLWPRTITQGIGYPLWGATLIALTLVCWLIAAMVRWRQLHKADRAYARNLVRSATPMIAVMTMLLALAGGASLMYMDHALGRELQKHGRFGVLHEMNLPSADAIKKIIAQELPLD